MAGGDGDSSADTTPPIGDASAHRFLQSNSIADFLRLKKGSSTGTGEFQTAVVSYTKTFPWSILHPLLRVDLFSAVHIADKHYFTTLQKELEPYDCVLFEMVARRESFENGRHPSTLKRSTGLCSRRFNILRFVQRLMARILRLGYQLDCLDYQAENWYHADLDDETFKLLQLEKGESFFTFAINVAVGSVKAMLRSMIPKDRGPWRSKLLWASRVLSMPLVGLLWASCVLSMPLVVLFIIGSVWNVESQAEYPEVEALFRLDFGAAMKLFLAKLLTSEFMQVTCDMEESSVIIGERNKAAIDALRSAMDEGHNKIAILYGGAHMLDLGRRLQEEFDLFPSQVQWITAWSIRNTKTTSFPFLTRMAQVLGWPLNKYRIPSFLISSSGLALHLWQWKLFFRSILLHWKLFFRSILTVVNWISQLASIVNQYLLITQVM